MRKLVLLPSIKKEVDKSFINKLVVSKGLIAKNLLKCKKPCVAFSGGKDSLVVLHLIRQVKKDILVMFNDTGIEHKETYEFVDFLEKEWDLNLIRTKPEKGFWQCIKEYGVPGNKGRYKKGKWPKCCYWLKEKPTRQEIKKCRLDCCFTGLTAVESRPRMFTIAKYGVCYYTKKWGIQKVHPIAYWTPEDVWKYIKELGLPYNKIYDQGFERCGCAFCTSHLGWKEQINKKYPRVYEHLISLKEGDL